MLFHEIAQLITHHFGVDIPLFDKTAGSAQAVVEKDINTDPCGG
jgi:hypothetical protein